MKVIVKILGGSHLYGLNTANSDRDERGIFINTEVSTILGLEKHEYNVSQTNQEDISYKEVRRAIDLIRRGNSEMIETLFCDDYLEIQPEWKLVVENRNSLLDSENLYKCLKGYIQSERQFAMGIRSGKLGGKRKEIVDKLGFSPKNFVQLFRLSFCGEYFFQNGVFPVKIKNYKEQFHSFLLDLKTNPEKHNKLALNEMSHYLEYLMDEAYKNRAKTFKFNETLANGLIFDIYYPILRGIYKTL